MYRTSKVPRKLSTQKVFNLLNNLRREREERGRGREEEEEEGRGGKKGRKRKRREGMLNWLPILEL